MSTNFPAALDSYTTWVDNIDDVMAAMVNNPQDAIEALEAKVGIDVSGVSTSHDYKLAHLIKSSGATAFNGTMTAADAWQTLDLSSYVGVNSGLVFLEVHCNLDNQVFYIKPTGYGGTPPSAKHWTRSESGGGSFRTYGADCFTYFAMMTGTAGTIQIASNGVSGTWIIKVVSFIRNA